MFLVSFGSLLLICTVAMPSSLRSSKQAGAVSCAARVSIPLTLVRALAAGLGRDLGRAGDLLEGDRRVVRASEPVKAPVAPVLELVREAGALGFAADAAVLLAPSVRGGSVFARPFLSATWVGERCKGTELGSQAYIGSCRH